MLIRTILDARRPLLKTGRLIRKELIMTTKRLVTLAGAVMILALAPTAFAQDFAIDWWTIDGGGEMFSSGGDFELGGSIAQPDANPVVLTGGDFELTGGFWVVAGAPCDPCDMDCDGIVNAFDIEPFLDLLFDPKATPCDTCTGDVDGNGVINAFDIEPFLNCLFP